MLHHCPLFFWRYMSAPTKQEMLDNVETAINNLMTGGAVQSYSISGRNLQHFSLGELRSLRDQLKREIASDGGLDTRTHISFVDPT